MKTAVLLLSAALAAVEASNGSLHCPRANANFCMGGDIILRCDENGVATPGRCSSNLAGYAPAGGPASCYESEPNAGDAACQKNCVVYADKPFTLGGCRPTFTAATPTATGAPSTVTTLIIVPTGAPCKHCNGTTTPPGSNPPGSNPPGSNPPSSNPPGSNPPGSNPPPAQPPYPLYPNGNGTNPIGTGTGVGFPSPTGTPGNSGNGGGNNGGNNNNNNNGGNGGNNNGGNSDNNGGNGNNNNGGNNGGNGNGDSTRTNVPISPTSAIPEPPPPSGAGANKASLILAVAGVIAAYIL